jgi:hypothetical protein
MDFASFLGEIEEKTCPCGYKGKVYMFVTINGKTTCVRCAGCKEPVDDRAQAKRAAAKRGAEKLQLRNSRTSWE